jgi:hypothetical protein
MGQEMNRVMTAAIIAAAALFLAIVALLATM